MSQHTEVELRLPALLPDDYIPDVNMRLSMYKRIASAADEQELRELKVELIDRFGLLPEPTKTLLELAAFRQRATALGIRRVEMSERGGYLDFTQETKVNPAYLVKLLSEQPRIYKMDGPTRLRFQVPTQDRAMRLKLVDGLLAHPAEQQLWRGKNKNGIPAFCQLARAVFLSRQWEKGPMRGQSKPVLTLSSPRVTSIAPVLAAA
jgi:transcription-repair coupling factor (superfamily II helicase)